MFAREGYPFILGAAALAAVAFAMALKLRSWPLWLAALTLTIIALWVAWFFRNPTRLGERGANVALAPSDAACSLRTEKPTVVHGERVRTGTGVDRFLPFDAKFRVALGQLTVQRQPVIADVPAT